MTTGKYAVQIIAKSAKGEEQIYYIGKDGYVHDSLTECSLTGWTHPRWAQKYIDEDREWHEKWNAERVNKWDYEYAIVTVLRPLTRI